MICCRVYENCLGISLPTGEGSPGHLDPATDAQFSPICITWGVAQPFPEAPYSLGVEHSGLTQRASGSNLASVNKMS